MTQKKLSCKEECEFFGQEDPCGWAPDGCLSQARKERLEGFTEEQMKNYNSQIKDHMGLTKWLIQRVLLEDQLAPEAASFTHEIEGVKYECVLRKVE